MKKKVLLTISIILISFLQNSCGSKRISKKIIVASSGKIESLDPARANTLKSIQLISSLGDTLYELNSNGELIPELASGMPIISKDRLQIIGIDMCKEICWVREWPFACNSKKTFALEISQITLQIYCSNNSSEKLSNNEI